MTREEIFPKVVEILMKYSKAEVATDKITDETAILDDLKINSARLVDIILDFEDAFDIQVDDAEADKVNTVGDSVSLIASKTG